MITCGSRTLLAKTCPLCGAFKQASEFTMATKTRRHSWCRPCKNANPSKNVSASKNQQKSMETAGKHRQPWTDAEVQRLIVMRELGLTGHEIALALNRTVYAVYIMASRLNQETQS